MTLLRAAVLCLAACLLGGCEQRPQQATPTEGKGASGPGTSAASGARLPAPIKLADTLIPEGTIHNLGFTLEFRIRRNEADEGKSYDAAAASCRASGRMLCTETQWLRACQAHPAIGRMESWTASRRGSQAVVRGGGDCSRRLRVEGRDTQPRRGGLCCERAVALRTSGNAGPWLGIGSRLPLKLEKAFNDGDEEALRFLFADQVIREGRKWEQDALIAHEKKERETIRWMLFDRCDLRSGPVVVDKDGVRTGRLQGMLLNCRTVLSRNNDVLDYDTKLGWVQSDGDERYRLAQIDHKSASVIPGAR